MHSSVGLSPTEVVLIRQSASSIFKSSMVGTTSTKPISRRQLRSSTNSLAVDMGLVEVVPTIDDLNIELADCLINTTSVGLKPTDECIVDPDMLHKGLFVYDVIYNPKQTKLLKLAKEKGAKTANGLGMLYYQGVLSLQHWANAELDDKVKSAMRRALDKGAK